MDKEEKKGIYGKKVFFVTQNRFLLGNVKPRLITMEYEIYVINDYKILKSVLLKNPDSICFISPDFQLSVNGWKNFIKSVYNNEDLSSIKIGILTKNDNQKEMENFKSDLKLEAGFKLIAKDEDELLQHIVHILDSLEAKGMRQYVRANCLNDKMSEIYWLSGDKMHKMQILDISAVGLAIHLPTKYFNVLKSGQCLNNAKLILNNRHIQLNLDIKMIKQSQNGFIAVAMFQMGISKENLDAIRTYISERLLSDLMNELKARSIDKVDYESVTFDEDNSTEEPSK